MHKFFGKILITPTFWIDTIKRFKVITNILICSNFVSIFDKNEY